MTKKVPPLSYSSAGLLKLCSQRYYFHKIEELAPDLDYADDTKAFDIGKAFHHILEHSNHENNRIKELAFECQKLYELTKGERLLVTAMVIKYLKLHGFSQLKVKVCELGLQTDKFIGFVDAVMVGPDGLWWLVDLKTAARLSDDTASRLHRDAQLNLYASFRDHICETLGLSPENFGGIRYRVTTKSKANLRRNETNSEFMKRIYKTIKSYDFIIPASLLDPTSAYEDHMKLHEKAQALVDGTEKPMRNFAGCFNYFRPCPYWSKCHGHNYTEGSDLILCKTLDDYQTR